MTALLYLQSAPTFPELLFSDTQHPGLSISFINASWKCETLEKPMSSRCGWESWDRALGSFLINPWLGCPSSVSSSNSHFLKYRSFYTGSSAVLGELHTLNSVADYIVHYYTNLRNVKCMKKYRVNKHWSNLPTFPQPAINNYEHFVISTFPQSLELPGLILSSLTQSPSATIMMKCVLIQPALEHLKIILISF